MSQDKGLLPWAWVGCGCVGAIVALVAIAVGLGFWGVNKAREFGESMKDPEERTARALSALGASELPDGYYAVVAFSVPFVFDFAMLSDEPPKEDGEPSMGKHGFIFVSFPAVGEGDEELYDFFEGRSEDVNSLRRENLDLDLDERLDRGLLERDTDDILWVTHRGRVSTDQVGTGTDQVGTGTDQVDDSHDGLVTLTLFACDDDRRRLGVWFGPDPFPETPAEDLDLRGTVGDPAEIGAFMAAMEPCF